MEYSAFTPSRAARSMRWLMLAVILLDIVLTAIGQPPAYWQHPQSADEGNHLFHAVMLQGPAAWICFEIVYLAVAFLLASFTGGPCALFAVFSYILGHYYGACTWLTNHWHLGTASAVLYAMVIAAAMVALAFPSAPADRAVPARS